MHLYAFVLVVVVVGHWHVEVVVVVVIGHVELAVWTCQGGGVMCNVIINKRRDKYIKNLPGSSSSSSSM